MTQTLSLDLPGPGEEKGQTTLPLLGQGFHFQDLQAGQRFQTFRRTITEADLVNFISATGMLESNFIDAQYGAGALGARPVPGALTYCLIEGFILQSMLQGTGLANLELNLRILAPVRVNDAIYAVVTVTGVKPTSAGDRAIVDSTVDVFNHRSEQVMTYVARRMLAGKS